MLARVALELTPIQRHPPASSSPFPASAVTSAGTDLPAPLGVASENPRWFGNLVHSRPPTRERLRLPSITSGYCATKTLLRSTCRARSWSSSADDTAVVPDHPFHTRTQSPKGSTDPPRRTRKRPSGHPATIRGGSEVKVNFVQEARIGRFSPWFPIICTPLRSFSSQFCRNKNKFSDALLGRKWTNRLRRITSDDCRYVMLLFI